LRSSLQTATELRADLIVMTTDGPDEFLDGLRGTTSECVLRKVRCPVANLCLELAEFFAKNCFK
jgi:nucleotide-binding universal stress UspA family protein